jgi:hypothetical protein
MDDMEPQGWDVVCRSREVCSPSEGAVNLNETHRGKSRHADAQAILPELCCSCVDGRHAAEEAHIASSLVDIMVSHATSLHKAAREGRAQGNMVT